MLKRSITYTNPFTEQEVTEDHYFHISKADLVKMQMENVNEPSVQGDDGEKLEGYRAKLVRIMRAQDGKELVAAIEDLVKRAYGKKDGDRFLKSKEIWEDFAASEAYSQLFWELCTDSDKASSFMIGIIPGDLDSEAAKLALAQIEADAAQNGGQNAVTETSPPSPDIEPPTSGEAQLLTRQEALEMDSITLQNGLRDGRYKLS